LTVVFTPKLSSVLVVEGNLLLAMLIASQVSGYGYAFEAYLAIVSAVLFPKNIAVTRRPLFFYS